MYLFSKTLARVSLFIVALFVLTTSAMAQGGKGVVTGQIEDTQGGVLQGARVLLEPGDISRVTDAQGEFSVTGLEPGTYTVTVSFVGLEPFLSTLEVKAGSASRVEAKLKVSAQSEEVIVTVERPRAEAAAINRERGADNLVQVLPADVIRSLPNANMADALGRLPSVTLERDEGEGKYVQVRGTEPRLTNTTIDGIAVPSPESGVRQIKFDAIPADLVESVEINKTLQANMDGDGIGGSVNLVTKIAEDRPTISVNGMGGYMPILGGRGQLETAATIGQRFGSEKRWGVLIGGTYDWSGRGIDDIEPVSDLATLPSGQQVLWKDSIDIREYRYYRSRWGLAGSVDYKLSEGSNLYIHGFYSDFKNYGDRWVYSLNDNSGANTLQGGGGTPSFSTQDRRPDIAIASVLVGGKHYFTNRWFAWDGAVSRSRDINVNAGQGSFDSTLVSSNCQYDPAATTNIYVPQWTPACFSEIADPATFSLSKIKVDRGLSAQLNLQVTGAMAQRYHIAGHLATIEVGGKFRNAHKFDDTYTDTYEPNGTILLNQFPNDFRNDNYYGGHYTLSYNPTYERIASFLSGNLSQFSLDSSKGLDPANYGLVERVSAGYVMNTVDLGSHLRLVAGVRFEDTNLDTNTPKFDDQGNFVGFTKTNGSYLKVLPSVSLRYGLGANTDLRLVYGRGLSRPDPQDIAQAFTYTLVTSGSPKNTVTFGNPNLRAETGDNFDVLIQHYLKPFGMIEGGFFYKRLTDPIVSQTTILQNYTPAPGVVPPGQFYATQPVNAGDAWIAGFETAYLQHFTFLPGKLGGLGLSANYGYTNSSTSGLVGRSDHPRLLRNAPNTWNISPTYDRGRFSIRVGLSYNQANIYSYLYTDGTAGGPRGPLGDINFYSHLQVDAQGTMRLAHGLSFVAYGLNLTNEVFGFYQGSTEFMIQREYYRPTYAAGLRWNPVFEKR